jgi:hypothetical protein
MVKNEGLRTVEKAVEEKMLVLEEFCVVDKNNESQIKAMLWEAIHKYPNRDFDIVLDQVAKMLISEKLHSLK